MFQRTLISEGFQLILSNEYKRLKDIWQSIFLPEAFLIIIRILSHLILVFHTTEGDWKGCSSKNKQSRFNFYKIFTVCVCMEMFVCLFFCRRPPDGPAIRCCGRGGLVERVWKRDLPHETEDHLSYFSRLSTEYFCLSVDVQLEACSAESKPTAR